MALNILKRDIAGPGAAADFQASLERYSLTDRAPVVVANQTEANQLATQLRSAGKMEAFPLFVYTEFSMRHLCKPSPDDPWIILGGRLHGAQARVDRKCDPGVETELHINEVGFLRQSVGFTRAPNGGLLIPEDGLYRLQLSGHVDGLVTLGEPGRRYVRLLKDNQPLGGRADFEGDVHFNLALEWHFEKGDVIMPVGYQNIVNQGVTRSRLISATLGAYQSLTPSW